MPEMHKANNPDLKAKGEPSAELESEFIIRLPQEPAKVLRETLRNGLPLKERLGIKLENDMRYGEVRFDHWLLHAKLLICKEEDDQTTTDEESPVRQKKKDPNKVDKKFLWPHGITPPTKNVRRRRFRKTLKKKYVEAPEIEKEVKRLLRVDNEAVNVKWEVICDDEDQTKPTKISSSGTVKGKRDNFDGNTSQSVDVAEHDIFGEPVSDSEEDDEEGNINVMELDENSQLSADSRISDSNSMQVRYSERSGNTVVSTSEGLITHFSKEMFQPKDADDDDDRTNIAEESKVPKLESFNSEYIIPETEHFSESQTLPINKDSLLERREILHIELAELRQRRQQRELEITSIENVKLRQRFQEISDNLLSLEMQKLQEIQDLEQD